MDGSWPGCRCTKCTKAQARGGKTRRLQHLRGQGPLIPGGPVVEHIAKLHDSGMSYALIARRAEVSDATITYLVRGVTKNCKRGNAARILAVQPLDFDTTAMRPALGAIRRLRALYSIGHNPETIGAATGLDQSAVSHLANGRHETVTAATDEAIRSAYLKLCTTPGPSQKAKRRAASLGWHGPLAWDGNIDDPQARPEKARPYQPLAKNGRDSMRKAEIEHLYLLGESVPSIAKQLAGNEKYISDQLGEVLRERAARAEAERQAAKQRTAVAA
jgi:transcriptional regulator with XRE-family HTH domain